MAVGLSATMGNAILNVYRGTTLTGVTIWAKLHTADPGAAGATAASAVTTRNQVTFAAAAGLSMTLSTVSSWSMTTTETISHISLWDQSVGGNFEQSAALSVAQSVVNTNTLSLTTLTLSYAPAAA
jgi:3-deoxy-D-arabino-heptulosonate 7-phosphate (DAHP) synthase class II